MPRLKCLSLICFITTFSLSAYSNISVDDILSIRHFSDIRVSPNGKNVAYVVVGPTIGAMRSKTVKVFNFETQQTIALGASQDTTWLPQWDIKGSLYYLKKSNDAKHASLVRLINSGGSSVEEILFENASAVLRYAVSPNGETIAYTSKTPVVRVDDEVVVGEEGRAQLWSMDLRSGKAMALTSPQWEVSEFKWFSDNQRLALIGRDEHNQDLFLDKIAVVDARTAALSVIFKNGHVVQNLDVEPNGERIGFLTSPIPTPKGFDLYTYDAGSGAVRNVSRLIDRAVQSYQFTGDGEIIVSFMTDFSTRLLRYGTPAAKKSMRWREEMSLGSLSIFSQVSSSAQRVVFDANNGFFPPELYLLTPLGAKKITDENRRWQGVTLPQTHFKNIEPPGSLPFKGMIIYPPNYDSKKSYPLVTFIHGGPADRFTTMGDTRGWAGVIASFGYIVFCPNQRGSTGSTLDSMMSISKDWGGQDLKDIVFGVRTLVEQGIADPQRLAIVGWSYGGYMAQMAVGKTNVFKAAVAGAGMGDLALEFRIEDKIGRAMDRTFNGTPDENPAVYRRLSPHTYANKINASVLLLQGTADDIDPLAQTQVYHHILRTNGKDVRLVLYPGEGHRIAKDTHIRSILKEIKEWLDIKMGGVAPCELQLKKL